MKTYKSFDELNGKTLQPHDVVCFGPVRYEVNSKFLYSPRGNRHIFDLMFKDKSENFKCDFAELLYGYKDQGGNWPEVKKDDYEALTRLVLALFAMYEGETRIEMQYPDGSWKTVDLSKWGKPIKSRARIVEIGTDYIGIISKGSNTVEVSYDDDVKINKAKIERILANMKTAPKSGKTHKILCWKDAKIYPTHYRIGCQIITKKQLLEMRKAIEWGEKK